MKLSTKIVNEIVCDLSDRRGLRHEWDQIDTSIKNEIKAKWREIVEKAIEADREEQRVEQVNRSIYPGK